MLVKAAFLASAAPPPVLTEVAAAAFLAGVALPPVLADAAAAALLAVTAHPPVFADAARAALFAGVALPPVRTGHPIGHGAFFPGAAGGARSAHNSLLHALTCHALPCSCPMEDLTYRGMKGVSVNRGANDVRVLYHRDPFSPLLSGGF